MRIINNATDLTKNFNWDIDELLTLDEFANAKEIVVVDANLYYIYLIVDGRACNVDVNGIIEWVETHMTEFFKDALVLMQKWDLDILTCKDVMDVYHDNSPSTFKFELSNNILHVKQYVDGVEYDEMTFNVTAGG